MADLYLHHIFHPHHNHLTFFSSLDLNFGTPPAAGDVDADPFRWRLKRMKDLKEQHQQKLNGQPADEVEQLKK